MDTATPGCMAERSERELAVVRQMHEQRLFAEVDRGELACLVAEATEQEHPAGVELAQEQGQLHEFLILLQGDVRITRRGAGGAEIFFKIVKAPSFMGEIPLLSNVPNNMTVTTATTTVGLHVAEEAFWRLMAKCPTLRAVILREMGVRTRGMLVMNTQQEKLAMLGTMTAGLLHELNNPGAAAKRAATLLRDNLKQLHVLARSFSERGHSAEQRICLSALQEQVLALKGAICMDSLQQADAEEVMATWLEEQGINDAWNMAPTLVSSGLTPQALQCLQAVFPGNALGEPLRWLEATASSMQQVDLVEESVSRVHELAKAAKSYVHEGQGGKQTVQVNESLHATLVILKHKIREKGLHLEKNFGAALPPLTCVCSGLNQIWTNLLDNAIDAAGPGGHLRVHTWQEEDSILVGIGDDGPGISPEERERIFDPFYTTKPVGVGTGMGLGIVQRMVENYHGALTLRSVPGDTEFIVRIPLAPANPSTQS